MTTIDFAGLTKMAQDAGFDTTELGAGTYTAEVKVGKFGKTQGGKDQFGFRFVVSGGPSQGQGIWKNLTVPTADSKPAAASIFLREMAALGIDQTLASQNPDAAAKAIVGRQFTIEVKRTREKQGSPGEFWTDVNVKPAPASVAPAPVQQTFPAAGEAYSPGSGGSVGAAAPVWQQGNRPI